MIDQVESLKDRVSGYLKSIGFDLLETEEDFLVAQGEDLHGVQDTRLVWVVPTVNITDAGLASLERRLLPQFARKTQQYPESSRWIVTHVRGEFSRKFTLEASKYGIEQRAEIQFFDTPFRTETGRGRRAASVISSLRDGARSLKRTPQRYTVLVDDEGREGGHDLLDHLLDLDKLAGPDHSCLHIIVGPAGCGKTLLFQHLFARLYEHFLDQKRRQEVFPRPIPLVPDYLRGADTLRRQELIGRFMGTEVAVNVPQETFEWMITNGYAMWLFDGLDELYAGDRDFFVDLTKLLQAPNSKAQIFIWARDSLLSSCDTFREFLEVHAPGGREPAVRLYRLDDWDRSSKRAFAWLRLERHIPSELTEDSPQVSRFLTYVEGSDALRSLSSLPYYCELLLDEFLRGSQADFSDDLALIAHAVEEISRRELEKGILSLQHFQANGFNEWLETVASEFYAANFKGVEIADVETYANLVLHSELSEEERHDTITSLIQFPLLAPGPERGVVAFQHELIAEYLAGRFWLSRIANEPVRVLQELGRRIDFADSLIGRYIGSRLQGQQEAFRALVRTLETDPLSETAFTNGLQLVLLAAPTSDVLKRHVIYLEGRDLSHVHFVDADLRGISLRNCNLADTVFRHCDLRGVKFEGAYLTGTKFDSLAREALQGATFGDMARFDSIYLDNRRIEDREDLLRWIENVTGRPEHIAQPCPTALQLRNLFLKFFWPDGRTRRAKLPESFLAKGKPYSGAASARDCMDACLRFGYLQGPDYRHYIKRSLGDRYTDMKHFVTDWRLSTDMRQMLDSLCPEIDCRHVPLTT